MESSKSSAWHPFVLDDIEALRHEPAEIDLYMPTAPLPGPSSYRVKPHSQNRSSSSKPGGLVDRLLWSLSTCSRGGSQEHGSGRWNLGAVHSVLGLEPPWVVEDVKLDVPAKRIDFGVNCCGTLLSSPAYLTVVHDLDAKRLLFATEDRDYKTVVDFTFALKVHGGDPAEVRHDCMDMDAAYAKGVALALPHAKISYDRLHSIAMAILAMDDVRREELRIETEKVAAALLAAGPGTRHHLLWGMRKTPLGWTLAQSSAMHWQERSALKSARAWRLRMALREIYARARQPDSAQQAAGDLAAWTSWVRRCRLEPFKKLAMKIKERVDAVVRGLLDHRSYACVKSMNGQLARA